MTSQHNAPLPDGLTLSAYRIVKKIAVGGFSIVYLAEDEQGESVVIKEYLPGSLARRLEGELRPVVLPENLKLYRIGLKYFFDEGRVLASIAHPNVVRVLNFFRANDTVYLVMAYERGRSLQEHILYRRQISGKPLMTEQDIQRLFGQLLDALREVHLRKLLHLDLKPANIYLRADGTPMLLDFGAARQILHADLAKLHPMYTPGFAAPELSTKIGLGPWTDIYSIGASIFACMAGKPPQSAIERQENDQMDACCQPLFDMYSSKLIALMRGSLMLDPLQRPQSVFALQKLLRESADDASATSRLLSHFRRLVY